MTRILVPTDFSEPSLATVRYGIELATAVGGDEIVRVANEQHADLILLRARGLRGWRHVFRRTIADRVRRQALIPVVTLDANDLHMGQDLGRLGVPDQHLGSGRALSQSAELVGVVKDLDTSHRLPSVETTSQPREAAYDDPEPYALPYSTRPDERGGCQRGAEEACRCLHAAAALRLKPSPLCNRAHVYG